MIGAVVAFIPWIAKERCHMQALHWLKINGGED